MDNDKHFSAYLKAARISAKITVSEISNHLTSLGYKASEKTIYSWESGRSQPTPDALLVMCKFYGVKDILSAFGYKKSSFATNLQVTASWQKLHNNFEKLNDSGQDRLVEYSDFLVSKEEYQKAAMVPASKEDTEQKPVETVRVWQAARSTDNSTPSGWIDMPKEEVEKIFNAPESDADF